MKFEFIGNACGIFHGSKGTKVLCDPWIVDGVFEGSWFHYPPLKTTMADLQDVDAIYLSHIHPDHYDERYFDFRKDIPIFILDEKYKFLEKKLRAKGYENLAVIPDGKTHSFRELEVTLFAPFTKHPFFGCEVGNVIDSAMLIRDSDGTTAFNANDNTPTHRDCVEMSERFGRIDLAMMNYNAAGPYPSCFKMKLAQKREEHAWVLERNLEYLKQLLYSLGPKNFLPFAGSYVIGGSLSRKNRYLGTMTWEQCAAKLRFDVTMGHIGMIELRENDIFDIGSGTRNRTYVPLDSKKMKRYISSIHKRTYPYQKDCMPNISLLKDDVFIASDKMHKRMAKFGLKQAEASVFIRVCSQWVRVIKGKKPKRFLRCKVSPRLLRRILDRKANWNNAEIGCHIEFERNCHYEPDVHTALQFLHL